MRRQFFIVGVTLIAVLPWSVSGGEPAVQAIGASQPSDSEMVRLISRGDILRDSAPARGKGWLPLYQGNGRMGCCFGPWGLHANPDGGQGYRLGAPTSFLHIRHRTRAKFNADYLLPTAAVYWQQEPREVREFEQHQSFYDGTLRTHYRTNEYAVTVLSWIDPVHRDTAGLSIEAEGDCPAIIVAPLRNLSVHYDQKLEQTFTAGMAEGAWRATLNCLDAHSPLIVRSSADLDAVNEGVRIRLKPGRNDVLITVGEDPGVSGEESLRATRAWWHSTWANSGWLDLPDDIAQKVWVRSLAYILYSHNDDGLGDSPPSGFAGTGWPFPFPLDDSFRQPLLLATGQIDAARKWIEVWRDRIDGLQSYTRRMWHHDGILIPHVFPYGPFEGYHDPKPPNLMYYPLYNSGHMIRMAHQTAVMVNDPAWIRQYVEPLIEGAARFYLDIAEKKSDGLWHFFTAPSIGMDEHGGVDQPDYICTLFSAEYAFRQAIAYGLDRDGRCAAILRDGLAYKALLAPKGMYYANLGTGAHDLGRQKHPDQFFPLVHVPLGLDADAPTRRSYELRYEVTVGAKRPRFAGHTLGQFILASARMHDVAGWRKDWAQVQPARNADPDWIQIYESSGNGMAFFVTSHGLFAQAILEAVVSTWWGKLDLAACVPWQGHVRFGNIRTQLGVTVSGEVADGKGQAVLKAWKDTSFTYEGRTIALKRGEETTVHIGADN